MSSSGGSKPESPKADATAKVGAQRRSVGSGQQEKHVSQPPGSQQQHQSQPQHVGLETAAERSVPDGSASSGAAAVADVADVAATPTWRLSGPAASTAAQLTGRDIPAARYLDAADADAAVFNQAIDATLDALQHLANVLQLLRRPVVAPLPPQDPRRPLVSRSHVGAATPNPSINDVGQGGGGGIGAGDGNGDEDVDDDDEEVILPPSRKRLRQHASFTQQDGVALVGDSGMGIRSSSSISSGITAPVPRYYNEGTWLPQEEQLLHQAVELYGLGNWSRIARHIGTRKSQQVKKHCMTSAVMRRFQRDGSEPGATTQSASTLSGGVSAASAVEADK